MYEERKKFPFSTNLNNRNTFDPAMFSDEQIAQQLKDMRSLNERISTRVSGLGLLTLEQLKAFEASQDSALKMQETSFQMAAKMFRTREPQ
jgi:hypothetical protein